MATSSLSSRTGWLWAGWVVASLFLMPLVGEQPWLFAACVTGSALLVGLLTRSGPSSPPADSWTSDLATIAVLYVAVVAAMRLAFIGFGTDQIPGLFLSFAAALLLGVIGPVVATVWLRQGSLRDLGLQTGDLPRTAALAVVFAAVQFGITLWGYALPAPVEWVPLLVMALVVGVFESIFFRGFIQNRLEAHFGNRLGIGGAALLYGAYHVGFGMGLDDIVFLTGLGITYAVAFSLTRSVFVLWPLLTPLGSFYAQLENGDIELPWAAILGFADVALVMAMTFWLAHRHEKRRTPARTTMDALQH